ncbi:MAG: YggT family protein [Anaerolineae bacterium]
MTVLVSFIELLYNALFLAIFGRIILTWLRFDPYHPVSRFLVDVTEPILGPIRRALPPTGMFDLSPMFALLGLYLIRVVLVQFVLLTF